jgi:hypothetical protein
MRSLLPSESLRGDVAKMSSDGMLLKVVEAGGMKRGRGLELPAETTTSSTNSWEFLGVCIGVSSLTGGVLRVLAVMVSPSKC